METEHIPKGIYFPGLQPNWLENCKPKPKTISCGFAG
jgi:hypothetical protein